MLDVVELINAGADVRCLEQYGGHLVAVFDELVDEAVEGEVHHPPGVGGHSTAANALCRSVIGLRVVCLSCA